MKLIDLSVSDFASVTASNAPAPGGGSVSALVGSLSAALAEMVANLTVGREKYADAQQEMEELLATVTEIRQTLLLAVDADSKAFDRYMAALAMPKGTEEEKAVRSCAMQEGLKKAAEVPLSVANEAARLFPYLHKALTIGNPNAVTDAMVGTMLARTCILGAIFNVRVNLSSIRDEDFAAALHQKCNDLQALAIEQETALLKTTTLF